MKEDINHVAGLVYQVHDCLLKLSPPHRMKVGVLLAELFSRAGVLQTQSSNHTSWDYSHELKAGPLEIKIDASFKESDDEQAF